MTTANTTTPASLQVAIADPDEMFGAVESLYSIGVFPSFPCPEQLFLEILQINTLRFKNATTTGDVEAGMQDLALGVIGRIRKFEPVEWSRSSSLASHPTECLQIARIFQNAVAVYAFLSLPKQLQGEAGRASMSPDSSDIDRQELDQDQLFSLLEAATDSMIIRKTLIWPLMIAGVIAASGSPEQRRFVASRLLDISHETGSSSPLVAAHILEDFWNSGGTCWEDCFTYPSAVIA